MLLIKKYFAVALAHRLIVGAALVMSLLVSLPVILFPILARDSYQGINIAHFGTDEHYYLTRAKEILEGHGLGNIVLREQKDAQEPQFTYVEYLLLLPVRALGLADVVNVVTLYNVYNFLGVFVLILLIYFFTLEVKSDKKFALLATLFVVGGYSIIYNKTIGSPELNIYGRAIFPYMSLIAFFIFARLLLVSLKSQDWKKALWAGISFGALFYIFFFAWSFALALLGSLFLVYLLKRDFIKVKKLAVIFGVGLLLGAYNLARLLPFYESEHGRQLAFFLWSYFSHAPILSKIGLAMIILLGIFYYRRKQDENIGIIIGFMLAGWVALNQQIITGRVIQYGHYYWFFIVPTSIILGWYMVWSLVTSERSRRILLIATIAVVFINTVIGQYKTTLMSLPVKIDEQRYRPILTALQADREPGVVMAPDGYGGLLVAIYTPHDLLWNTTALVYTTSPERMEEVLTWFLYLTKDARKDPLKYLEQALADSDNATDSKALYIAIEGILSGWDSHVYAAKVETRDPEFLEHRKKLFSSLEKKYRAFAADTKNINIFLKKYGVTHIIWDNIKNPEWDLSIIPGLREVTVMHGVHLYELVIASK